MRDLGKTKYEQSEKHSNALVRDLGIQPIAALLDRRGLTNHALVAASAEPLTHKMIARARKGRRLTPKVKRKIIKALNQAILLQSQSGNAGDEDVHRDTSPTSFDGKDLFNY